MNLAGWRFLLFALVGAATIVLLASIGTPSTGGEDIDRHTGRRIVVVRTAGDALFEARKTGNTHKARERLAAHLPVFPDAPTLAGLYAVLAAELAPFDASLRHPHPDSDPTPDPTPDPKPESKTLPEADPAAHPAAAVIAAEQRRARARHLELKRRTGERLRHEPLLALLIELEADRAIASETEKFYAPLARWSKERPDETRPDALAAYAKRLLEGPEPEPVPTDGDPPESSARGTTAESQNDQAEILELLLDVARAFQAHQRPRAQRRWLLRAYGAFPASTEVRDALIAAYLAVGRTPEAFLLTANAVREDPDSRESWELRARIAMWLSQHEAEVEAHEWLLRVDDTEERRERIITLHSVLSRPAAAVPHALALAEREPDRASRQRAVNLALRAGDVDAALEMLESFARGSKDQAHWREKIVLYAGQDLRIERMIAELKTLHELYPDRDYEARLERSLRRNNQQEQLVALLEDRLAREPGNTELEAEVLALHDVLGHKARLLELLNARIQRETSPVTFFGNLPLYRANGVPELKDHARRMAAVPVEPSDVGPLLEALLPLEQDAFYRGLAESIARRHAKHPTARAWLVAHVDRGADPAARLARARELAAEHPDDDAYVTVWRERAAWAGAVAEEALAREAWTRLHAGDLGNRRALADLYAALHRPGDALVQWRAIVEREGPESPAALELIDVLFAVGEIKEAIEWLERRATLPGSSIGDRLHVADQLFGNEHFDRALHFYMAVLEEDPANAQALLRAGQIRSWTNDPRGAIPYLERRLDATNELASEVRFYLGEAHWAIRLDETARRYQEAALSDLIAQTPRSMEQDIMVARMLVRFERHAEAHPIFESVLRAAPDNTDLVLDYADSMIATGDVEKARELVDRAIALAPDKARARRLDGSVAIGEGRFEDAVETLENVLRIHGSDAGTESELGRAAHLAGAWQKAADAYQRSLDLQSDNADARQTLQHLADRVADLVHARFDYARTGDDERLSLWFAGSLYAKDGRRFAAEIGVAQHTGRAAAVQAGGADVDATVVPIHLSLFQRWERLNEIGGGVLLYPGAPGDFPAGFWLGGHLLELEPYRILEVRLHVHALLERPSAAPGLGGRTSGIRGRYQRDVLRRFWWSVELGWELLTLDSAETGDARDGYLEGAATFGWRVLEGPHRVADRPWILASPFPGLVGTWLDSEPGETASTHFSVWASYHFIRLLGSQELAALVPIGTRFDYLSLGARADWHVARALGVSLSATLGTELHDGEFFFELHASGTWRPEHRMELTAGVGFGTAQGREEDTKTLSFRLGFTYRW